MAANNGNLLAAQARAHRALERVLKRPKRAILGWRKSETEVVIDAPGGLGRVYITWQPNGPVAIAENNGGVPLARLLPVWVVPGQPPEIVKIDFSDPAAAAVALHNEYGVPNHHATHQHGGSDEIATATPAANAIPKADASGKLDSWVTHITQEQVEDWAAAMLTGNTGIIDAAYDDDTGTITLTLDVSAADKILYSTAADTWAETALTSFARTLLDDSSAATARTTLGISVYDQETAEDVVGAMVSGNTETGITVTYDDSTGKLNFVVAAQDHGSLGGLSDNDHPQYGRLSADNEWTGDQTFENASPIITFTATNGLSGARFNVDDTQANLVYRFQYLGNNLFVLRNDGEIDVSVMPGFNAEGVLRLTRADGVTSRYHDIKAYVDTVAANNYMTFAVHTGTANTVADVLKLFGSGKVAVGGLTSIGASVLGIKTGGASNDAAVGGVLYAAPLSTGNVGTGEDELFSYSLPANTLSANGMSIEIEAVVTSASTANAKSSTLYFGSKTFGVFNHPGGGIADTFVVRVIGMRIGTTSQRWIVATNNGASNVTTSSETLSSAVTIKVTGTGVANNDIVINQIRIIWYDVNS